MGDRSLAEKFGTVLRQVRLEEGLSQEALADKSGLHRTYIGNIERGEKTVTISTADKLARALGLTLTELFRRVEDVGVTDPRGGAPSVDGRRKR